MAVMRNAPFLRVVGDEALKLLAFGSLPRTLRPRQTLFEAGDEAEGAILLLGGQLRLMPPSPTAEPWIVGVGHLLDELALVVPTRRTVRAEAQTTCEVLVVQRDQMRRILTEYPDAARNLSAQLTRRTSSLIRDVTALADRMTRD